MNNSLPYVPDIDRLLSTLRKMGGSKPGDWERDCYASFWIGEGAVVLKNQEYSVAPSFLPVVTNDGEEARNAFWKWQGTMDPMEAILKVVGKNGASFSELIARL
jgi:hypothetical protein